jgi:diguanylate cyclase (GGDEF)-like protein
MRHSSPSPANDAGLRALLDVVAAGADVGRVVAVLPGAVGVPRAWLHRDLGESPPAGRLHDVRAADGHWLATLVLPEETNPDRRRLRAAMQLLGLALERAELAARERVAAIHEQVDLLTGLPHRRVIENVLGRAMTFDARTGRLTAVLHVHIRGLGHLNAEHGHDAGDEVIRHAADRMRLILRGGDTLVRTGGGHFIVICPALHHTRDLALIARRVLDAVCESYDLPGELEAVVPANLGAALLPSGGAKLPAREMLRRAHSALRQARLAGRNGWAGFDARAASRAKRQLVLEDDLAVALRAAAAGEATSLRLDWQARFDEFGRRVAAEALPRWHHPRGGDVAVLEVAPTDLRPALQQWVLRQACDQAVAWRAAGQACRIVLRIEAAAGVIAQALASSGLPGEALELMLPGAAEPATLVALDQLGVRLTLTDFGTGPTPLARLASWHAVRLQATLLDQADEKLAQAVVAVARAASLDVVAADVRTPLQRERARRLGVDAVQGDALAEPCRAAALPPAIAPLATAA